MLEDALLSSINATIWKHYCETDGFADLAMIALTLASVHDSGLDAVLCAAVRVEWDMVAWYFGLTWIY
jgi:hypothetical protein